MTHQPDTAPDHEQTLRTRIRSLWQRELGLDDIDDDEDVFDLGASSLHAIRVLSAIEREHGILIDLPVFLKEPSVAGLARVVRRG